MNVASVDIEGKVVMIIARFHAEPPNILRALANAPEMIVKIVELQSIEDLPLHFIFWAWGGSFERFEGGLEDDPTVRSFKRLVDVNGRRLYRVEFSRADSRTLGVYRAVVESDAVILLAIYRRPHWDVRFQFPDREAMRTFYDRYRSLGLSISIETVYEEDALSPESASGLTASQTTALLQAKQMGYYAVPKRATLHEVSVALGISEQAASARLRRGINNLVDHTLVDER